MTNQVVETISYNRPRNAIANNLPASMSFSYDSGTGKGKVTWELTLDPANVSQLTQVTITAGTAGDLYRINIDGENYIYEMQSGETAADIATALAKRIDIDAAVYATVNSGVTNQIDIKGVVPGTAITINNTGSTNTANLTLVTPTAASGTPKHRKIAEVMIDTKITPDTYYPAIDMTTQFYNGDDPATTASQAATSRTETYRTSIDTIQTTEGVPRT